MSSVVISGDTSGAITLQSPAVAGNTTLNLPASSGTVLTQNSSAPANSFVVDASGNVGIGTSSPNTKIEIVNGKLQVNSGGSLNFAGAGVINAYGGSSSRIHFYDNSNQCSVGSVQVGAGSELTFQTSGTTERMRIDGSGNVLVGVTSTPSGSVGGAGFIREASSRSTLYCASTTSASTSLVYFFNSNGLVGRIDTSASATSYVTSSDYRLKDNITPMVGALETIAQLNPVNWTWKVDGSSGQGFIAHELQAVVPDCVSGEKDAVDDDGNPVYQGVDTSFLVATLTKAIQELKAIVDEQAEKIKALEAK